MSSPRMDDWLSTVNDCEDELSLLNKKIEETSARKEQQQKALTMEREKNVDLRAQIQALRARECELEEQEKLEMEKIEEYNEALKASNVKLNKIREREMELHKLIVQTVSDFEEHSFNVARRFQSLELVEQDEDGEPNSLRTEMEIRVSDLEKEMAKMEAEKEALASSHSNLPLNELKDLVQDVNSKLENLNKMIQIAVNKDPSLKEKFPQL